MLIFIEKTYLLQLFIKQIYKTQVKKSLLNKQFNTMHLAKMSELFDKTGNMIDF